MLHIRQFLICGAVLILSGCAEGQVTPRDTGDPPTPDVGTTDPDMGSDDDGGTDDDGGLKPPPSGPSRAAISAGGGPRVSENFRLEVVVGTPAAASQLASENYRVGVGVGPFVTAPASLDPETAQ